MDKILFESKLPDDFDPIALAAKLREAADELEKSDSIVEIHMPGAAIFVDLDPECRECYGQRQ